MDVPEQQQGHASWKVSAEMVQAQPDTNNVPAPGGRTVSGRHARHPHLPPIARYATLRRAGTACVRSCRRADVVERPPWAASTVTGIPGVYCAQDRKDARGLHPSTSSVGCADEFERRADVVLTEAQRSFPLPRNGTLTPHATVTSMMTMRGLSLDAARTQILVEEGHARPSSHSGRPTHSPCPGP